MSEQKNITTRIMETTMENKMTAVEFIEKGIKVREKHWQDQYQQGYQRALSDIMLYIEEAKQMEKEHIMMAYNDGLINAGLKLNKKSIEYYNETYKK
jgi:hypothetical protein